MSIRRSTVSTACVRAHDLRAGDVVHLGQVATFMHSETGWVPAPHDSQWREVVLPEGEPAQHLLAGLPSEYVLIYLTYADPNDTVDRFGAFVLSRNALVPIQVDDDPSVSAM